MDLRARLSTLIAIRVVLSTVLLGSAILVELSSPGAFPLEAFFFLIGLTYALSIAYLATLRYVDRWPWLADAQLGADALLVSAFIQVTGGVTSYFSSLYLLAIIAASTLRFRRGALQVAMLSAVLYLALVSAQYLAVGGSWAGANGLTVELPSARFAGYTVAINLFGFFAVALLSGQLADRLRTAGAQLADVASEINDLRAYNQHVIDSLLSGLITADAEGHVLTFNRGAETITGLSAEQAMGRDIGEVLQLPVQFRASLPGLPHRRGVRLDMQFQTAGARVIELGATAAAVTFPNGRPGYLFTFQDVTDFKRLERSARLQQRLAAVGEMAAGIAHEIRNPLASISGSIQVLRHDLPLSEEQAQLMDIVLRESERLNETIRSFLAYARPQRQTISRFDVARTLQDTALLLRNSPELRPGHVIDVVVPDGPVWYDADENQMRQIVWNLATNGLRAMSSGGRLTLSADTAVRGDGLGEVVLSVADEGCGIPSDELDGIFQPFRGSFERGTGLGLAIVHRVVTDYEGAIQVSSTVGQGTTFSVRLPERAATQVAVPVARVAERVAV